MYQARYEKPPKSHSLFVAKKGGKRIPHLKQWHETLVNRYS